MPAATHDLYDVLGVQRDASQEEIRRAYRRLARRHHPDLSDDPAAEERFKAISEAYDVLGDPNKRAQYDRPQGTSGGVRVVFGDDGLDDLLGGLFAQGIADAGVFGGRARRPRSSARRARPPGRDAHVEVAIAPWQAALGAELDVPTPDGIARVRVPAGSSSGRRLRVRGRGHRGPEGTPGDLYVTLRIVVPEHLGEQERRLYEDLRAVSQRARRRDR
ncbi:MAG TPA: DnaJ domain-containing protein [Baekduia sp.]|nr:DnaJ domain-containing protein [Baekduia sp.]